MWPPHNAGNMIISRPMSWNSGSQLTLRMFESSPTEMIICSTLVHADRWVISTPAGVRVDPGGVLQVGDVVGVRRRVDELGAHGVGNRVDGNHPGPPCPR